MTTQAEQILENSLVNQLTGLGYEKVIIRDEADLLMNLKTQLEKHNGIQLSDNDFRQILNAINKGNIYERAKLLRERIPFVNAAGETRTIELIDQRKWCKNEFQVTQQVTMEGSYKNRYDVTLLINGLPLVQIELKRRGLELKEAFNQINRYERHSYGAGQGLFQFIQIFVISNGVNTKYYANGPVRARSFKQTFFWTDKLNKLITQLADFADVFLTPCHLAKMIVKYVVLNETQKILMVLRPYQYYATEAIVERVKNSKKFGYIWHTTGSGKTLTSFKTAQLLTQLPEVEKVVFVVDRKDLDYQTTKEFNSFSQGSIDGTDNTATLVKQLADPNIKLVVTTIQKLNTAISKKRYLKRMEARRREQLVFIFDECHRSQFGHTHKAILAFFEKAQLFGFTGTPIFADNASANQHGKRTTKMLFDDCLHRYVITDAIKDKNVLRFSVEYLRTFKRKAEIVDIEVEEIDRPEVMNAPQRLENVVDYIIEHHDRKTHQRKFTSIFCVSSVATLIDYYRIFRRKKVAGEHNLRVATIFSYQANEKDKGAVGDVQSEEDFLASDPYSQMLANEVAVPYGKPEKHTREHLDDFIADYNELYLTNFSTRDSKSFYQYYNDIARRVKHQQIDVLLVVNMFLTGFDSKTLNTLYVDKNLKYHGLIQAYSRTNRILNEVKSQGNIVSFRNLKAATDEAITLFSNKEAIEEIILAPYEDYTEKFRTAYADLLTITPTVDSVNGLPSEEEEAAFIQAFRRLMRLRNVLITFTEFDQADLEMSAQEFEDYKSKYLDLYERTHRSGEKDKHSILNDLDFELELIHRDEINVAYILKLIAGLKEASIEERRKREQDILDLMTGEVQLRSKRELIEQFIREHLPDIPDADAVPEAFEEYWNTQRVLAFNRLSQEEQLKNESLQKVIDNYLFTDKKPLRDEVIGMMKIRPGLRQRASTAERITGKIVGFVETFVSGLVA